jgi:hypothetical protein
VTFTATTALPYPHLERATAGLRAELRHELVDGDVRELPDWSSLEIAGLVETTDGSGLPTLLEPVLPDPDIAPAGNRSDPLIGGSPRSPRCAEPERHTEPQAPVPQRRREPRRQADLRPLLGSALRRGRFGTLYLAPASASWASN